MSVDSAELASQARSLKAAGRIEEAIVLLEQCVYAAQNSAVAEHNLASALGDAGRWREAEPHLRRVFALGGDAPESWLVFARCLKALVRLDEAERAYREAIKRRATLYDAHNELAQLRWMRTSDVGASLADLEEAINAAPEDTRLLMLKAQTLRYAERSEEAFTLLSALAAQRPREPAVLLMTAQIAQELGESSAALAWAESAAALAPAEPAVLNTLAFACLGTGQIQRAAAIAEECRRRMPLDQNAIALQATVWRLAGDRRYRELHDYDALTSVSFLDVPSDWPDLGAYLADLAEALHAAHAFRTHPFAQSVRHGSQAADILQSVHPAVRALPSALDGPIRRHLASLGTGGDPVRTRNTGGYKFGGMWSIRMGAGGRHIDHVHPQGWLSSACYVQLPAAGPDREGWLRLGKPGSATRPPLDAEHFIEPKPGLLALFPSYMWHGTIPFSGEGTRLTVAFDLLPA